MRSGTNGIPAACSSNRWHRLQMEDFLQKMSKSALTHAEKRDILEYGKYTCKSGLQGQGMQHTEVAGIGTG